MLQLELWQAGRIIFFSLLPSSLHNGIFETTFSNFWHFYEIFVYIHNFHFKKPDWFAHREYHIRRTILGFDDPFWLVWLFYFQNSLSNLYLFFSGLTELQKNFVNQKTRRINYFQCLSNSQSQCQVWWQILHFGHLGGVMQVFRVTENLQITNNQYCKYLTNFPIAPS